MIKHLLPFIAYLLIPFLVKDDYLSYIVKIVVVGGMLLYFWKDYKIEWKTTSYAVAAGAVIVLIWVGLEGVYPPIGEPTAYIPQNASMILAKMLGMILIAPILEEIFVRNYLHRILTKTDYEKVKHGTFTWTAFIITTLFFGIAHNRWLAGLVTGFILNIVYYKHKNIGSCIITHGTANLLLAVYVLLTQNWILW